MLSSLTDNNSTHMREELRDILVIERADILPGQKAELLKIPQCVQPVRRGERRGKVDTDVH